MNLMTSVQNDDVVFDCTCNTDIFPKTISVEINPFLFLVAPESSCLKGNQRDGDLSVGTSSTSVNYWSNSRETLVTNSPGYFIQYFRLSESEVGRHVQTRRMCSRILKI